MEKKLTRARRAALYRKASRNLAEQTNQSDAQANGTYYSPYSCDHIGNVCGLYVHETIGGDRMRFKALRDAYVELFSPTYPPAPFWNGWGDARNERILALCFMAAMVEAGDA